MRIFRFMSKEEFENYLKGDEIKGKFVKGKACFLGENVPARERDDSVKQLTDLPLDFKSTDFDGQMKELSELISPIFKDGDFNGKLKDLQYLSLADFMSIVRQNVTADVLVEFQPKEEFEKDYEKVVMSYRKYLIEEIQSNGYSKDTLDCKSYKIDLINGFKNGIGIDTIEKHEFEGAEKALLDLEKAKEEKRQVQSIEEKLDMDGLENIEEVANHVQGKANIYNNIGDQVTLSSILESAEKIKSLFDKVQDVQSQNHSISKVHGVQHVQNVLLLSNYIGLKDGISDKDLEMIREAAVYHDIAHEKPGHRQHAKNGADWYLENVDSNLNKEEVAYLIEAHELDKEEFSQLVQDKFPNISKNRKEELIKCAEILQDADRLDVLRYGIEFPDGQRFSPDRLNNFENAKLISAVLELNTKQAINKGYLDIKDGKIYATEKLEMMHEQERKDKEKEFEMARKEANTNSTNKEYEEKSITENEIGKITINTDTQKKDEAQKQIEDDLQRMQETNKNR